MTPSCWLSEFGRRRTLSPALSAIGRVGIVALLAAAATHATAAPAYKGMSYTSFGSNVLSSNASDQSLLNMSLVGTDTVALNFWWFQNSVTSNTMAEDDTRYSSTMSSVAHAIDTIHALGMKVLLKPMIDIDDGTWRAFADPSDKDQWFANYTNFIGTFADMAQSKGVELLSIGCEMNTLEKPANNQHWSDLIANMRSRYAGKLTYSANWGALSGNIGGYQNVQWWNQLDYVGIDAYFPIASQNNTTLAGLTSAWQSTANTIQNWRTSAGLTNKQLLFTEVGYQSADGSAQSPPGVSGSPPVDLQEQADSYQALLTVMNARPWWDGAFWWSWDTNPYAGGPNDNNFTPQNKPANQVLASVYGGHATSFRGAPTQTLFSWESGQENWQIAGFNTSLPATVAQSPQHATAGDHSLAVTQTGSGFSWDAGIHVGGDALAALVGALQDGASKYRLEFDVTYDTNLIPQGSVSFLAESVAINSTGGWSQVDGIAQTGGHTNQTIHVSQLLSNWSAIAPGSPWFDIYVALNGNWGSGAATVFLDNLRLVNLSAPLTGDYNHDGRVDTADYTVWRDTLGSTTDLRADGNLNGVVDSGDFLAWRANFGTLAAAGAAAAGVGVPEPNSMALGVLGSILIFFGRLYGVGRRFLLSLVQVL
jgi:hypothetical protein